MSSPHPRETFPRSARLRARRDFERVFRQKTRASDRWITLYGARNALGLVRLGIAAGRGLGKAVQRNRIKRRIREAFRRIRHDLPPGTDWIVMPRPGPEPTLAELHRGIQQLAARLSPRLAPLHPSGPQKPALRPPETST